MEARVQKRMSAREARGFLGLTAGPVAREKDISVSAASSADSADVAGGRAGSRVGAYSEDGGSGVGASRMGEVHVHPSRALWEAQPTPSPTATPSPPVNGNGNSYYHHANKKPPLERGGSSREAGWRRHSSGGGGGGRAGAGGGGGLTVDTFWSPVLPETSPAAPMDSSSLGDHWAWLQQQQQQQSSERTVASFQPSVYGLSSPSSHHRQFSAPAAITAAGAGVGAGMGMGIAAGGVFGEAIDRPASRGQEYRRQKKRKGGWLSNNSSRNSSNSDKNRNNSTSSSSISGQLPSASCSSSLMKSGSVEAQLHSAPVADDSTTRRRFWGLQWPLALPRIRRCRSEGQESRDSSPRGGGDGGGGRGGSFGGGGSWTGDGEWGVGEMMPPGSGNEESRLLVSVEGSTELGKGLGGHTAYRLQVTDRAAGEQWVVLRRFRQFEELHGELLHVFSREPDANAYVLPPKEVFGGRHGGVVVKRLKLLKVYLDRLVTCSAAVEHRATSSFLELDPALRGLGAYGRLHGPECVLKEGKLRVKEWKGPHKPVINILEAGLHLIGWTNCHAIVSPGPVFLVYRGREENPAKPFWSLPDRRTVGSQVRVRRVDMWRSDLEKDSTRLFLVSWEDISLLCQVDSDASLESWALSLDESVDLRPQQSELDRAKVDIELKAKEEWTSREEGIWGGL